MKKIISSIVFVAICFSGLAQGSTQGQAAFGKQYVSLNALNTILQTVCDGELDEHVDLNSKPEGKALIMTDLPKTGVDKTLPVYYETDHKGTYIAYLLLSHNPDEFNDAVKYIFSIAKDIYAPCLILRNYQLSSSAKGDTTILTFDRMPDIDNDFMQWIFYKHTVAPNDTYVVLAIKTMPYKIIDEQQKQAVKANSIYDKSFCDQLNTIITESKTGFKNVRSNENKDQFGHTIYSTSLPDFGFSKKYLQVNEEILTAIDRKQVVAYNAMYQFKKTEADAIKELETWVRKADGCLDYNSREVTNNRILGAQVTVKYHVKSNSGSPVVSFQLLSLGQDNWLVSIEVQDGSAKIN